MAIDLEKYRKATTTPAAPKRPIDLEKYRKPEPQPIGRELATGFVKGAIGSARGTAQLLQRAGQEIIGALPGVSREYALNETGFKSLNPRTPEGAGVDKLLESKSTAQKVGKAGAFATELFLPTPKTGVAAKVGKAVAPVLPQRLGQSEEAFNRALNEAFEKAVKPTIVGRKTADTAKRYQNSTIDAVNTIIENKPNLKFVSDEGEEATARLPQSLKEFSSAIEQTKKGIYSQYDALAQQAGKGGATIDLVPISDELDAVIGNEALRISHPEAVSYAKALKDRLVQAGQIDTKTAQDLIQNYNNSLEAFYRNPTFDAASRAAIYAGIVRSMRKQLDTVIESTTGSQYQALKNKYASLKAIESDVLKRANIDARKNQKGLVDFTDIFSGGDIVSGILSLNPAQFAKGVAQKGFAEYIKLRNNPNRTIRLLFEKAEKRRSTIPR